MDKKEIGNLILQRFVETNSKPNHVIDQRWLNFNLYNKLNPKEQDLVEPAINDLIEKGLIYIDNRSGGTCLVLTEQGYDTIFPIDEKQVIKKIQDKIMQRFEQQNSRPNHIVQIKWINMYLMQEFNPKERELFNLAIDEMINKGYVLYENRNGMDCLVLTEKGYEILY